MTKYIKACLSRDNKKMVQNEINKSGGNFYTKDLDYEGPVIKSYEEYKLIKLKLAIKEL